MRYLVPVHEHPAAGDAGLAADHVAQGRFAGAVGADDDAQLVEMDAQRFNIERFKAVEHHRHVFDVNDVAVEHLVVDDGRAGHGADHDWSASSVTGRSGCATTSNARRVRGINSLVAMAASVMMAVRRMYLSAIR